MANYCTSEQVAAEVGLTSTTGTTFLDLACSAAKKQVDAWCGRRFDQDTAVVAREFYATDYQCVDLLDQPDNQPSTEISTTTGLIVKTDADGDGTFETTLTISTDFILKPRNAAADSRGFSEIYLANNYSFPILSNGRAGVQVTAKFGWPSVPEDVQKAALIQAAQLYKARDAVFGAVAIGDSQAMFLRSSLNSTAAALLATYRKPAVG